MCRACAVVIVCWFAFGAVCPGIWADEPAPSGAPDARSAEAVRKFIRLKRADDGTPLGMETAVVRYAATEDDEQDLIVDLISVVHIGEKKYYEELNRRFDEYDALLYELVAPEGTRVPQGGARSDHPISMLQTGLKQMLELEYQLDFIDYGKENFVHADMSPEDFAKSMTQRGESIWKMVFRMMGQSIAQQSKNPNGSLDAELLLALFNRNRALALKRILAEQFEELEGMMLVFDGPDGSTIITERNKKALEVLAREIAAGKKRIGVFYGAGHMRDMEKRLLADFDLKRQEEQWLTAWDLRPRPPQKKTSKKPSQRLPAAEPAPQAEPVPQ